MRIALVLCTAALAAGCVSIGTEATAADQTCYLTTGFRKPKNAPIELSQPIAVGLTASDRAAGASVANCHANKAREVAFRDRVRAQYQREANAVNPSPIPVIQPELSNR